MSALTDRELFRWKIAIGDVGAANELAAIISTGTHAAITDRTQAILRAASAGKGTANDLCSAFISGGITLKDSTTRHLKLACGSPEVGGTISTKISAIT